MFALTTYRHAESGSLRPTSTRYGCYALLFFASIVCLASTWYFAYAIAPTALSADGPAIVPDLYPAWYASHQVLFNHGDPYGPEVTRQIQIAMLGRALDADSKIRNQQRFAYPVYSVFLFAPFAMLRFENAQTVALVVILALTILSVWWWTSRSSPPRLRILLVVFALASYPIVLGMQLRQPTLMVTALLAAVVYSLRSHRMALAGCLAAAATIKPQLAIAVLVPLLIWSLGDWRSRRRFTLTFAACECALLAASQALLPGWFPRWIQTLGAYAHYAGAKPYLSVFGTGGLQAGAAACLLAAVVWVSWRLREEDPMLAICFSITAFQLVFPFVMYNEAMLLPAVLWLALTTDKGSNGSQLFTLLHTMVWITLTAEWVAIFCLSLTNLLHPGSAGKFIAFALVPIWFLPIAMFAAFAGHAAKSLSGVAIAAPALSCQNQAPQNG